MGSELNVVGVGTDLVDVERFRIAHARRPRIEQRLFTNNEIERARTHVDPVPRLAARFAAKEAVMKALGVGFDQVPFREIEIVNAPSGAPSVVLHSKAQVFADQKSVTGWQLSMSHSQTGAIAVAIALA